MSTSLIQHPSPQAQISNNWMFAQNAVLYKRMYLIPLKIKKTVLLLELFIGKKYVTATVQIDSEFKYNFNEKQCLNVM